VDVALDAPRHHLDIAGVPRRMADQRRDRQRHLHHLAEQFGHGGVPR
jgi:hypothetical protein